MRKRRRARRYAVASCHVERPLDDACGRRTPPSFERKPAVSSSRRCMRPPEEPEASAGIRGSSARAKPPRPRRSACTRTGRGSRTLGRPAATRAACVRERSVGSRARGSTPRFFCRRGLVLDARSARWLPSSATATAPRRRSARHTSRPTRRGSRSLSRPRLASRRGRACSPPGDALAGMAVRAAFAADCRAASTCTSTTPTSSTRRRAALTWTLRAPRCAAAAAPRSTSCGVAPLRRSGRRAGRGRSLGSRDGAGTRSHEAHAREASQRRREAGGRSLRPALPPQPRPARAACGGWGASSRSLFLDVSGVALGLYAALVLREFVYGTLPAALGRPVAGREEWLPFLALVTVLVFWQARALRGRASCAAGLRARPLVAAPRRADHARVRDRHRPPVRRRTASSRRPSSSCDAHDRGPARELRGS